MSNIFEKYTNLYPVSKTLKFKLIPMFETEENIEKYNLLQIDEIRAADYKKVKVLFDRCHKAYIEKALTLTEAIDWTELYDALIESQQEKTDSFFKKADEYKKTISKLLTQNELYKLLTPDSIIKSAMKAENIFCDFNNEEIGYISNFNRFASYFTSYNQTRETFYGELEGSIAFRIVNDNFPIFIRNINLLNNIDENFAEELNSKIQVLTNGLHLKDIFSVDFFNNVLSQSGIDFYNSVIGGVSDTETSKIPGINELLNVAYQQGIISKKISFTVLKKQILSDKTQLSFIPEAYTNDLELLEELSGYGTALTEIIEENINDFLTVCTSPSIDLSKIYVQDKQLTQLSRILFGSWSKLEENLKKNKTPKAKAYSLDTLSLTTDKDIREELYKVFMESYTQMKLNYKLVQPILEADSIKSSDEIKAYLDSVQVCEKTLKIFAVSDDYNKEESFYSVFDLIYGVLRSNISIYNKVRNYITKKPYSTEKFKLNFEIPGLAGGWDLNKEYSYNSMLFLKDGMYYLGILNAKNKPKIKVSEEPIENGYQKMVYKLLPGPNKMLPKVFISSAKGLEKYKPSQYILDGYKEGRHKKGENFDLNFCHDLIDYFKDCINKHEEWSKFGFKFSDTSTYADISGFYREVENQGYKVGFSYVAEEEIKELVKEGKLFFFKLYNKDFSNYSKGSPNLHTLYFKELFTPENLKEPVFKLNGGSELFYRPASINNPFIHQKNSVLISKNDKNNQPVPYEVYEKATSDARNGMSVSELETVYPNLIFKTAKWDIVKDKRYSKSEFYFHVPLTINFGFDDKSKDINRMVLEDISCNSDINILSVARGERNLIYAMVIDQKGNIITQRTFNEIDNGVSSVNYHKKLDDLEKSRDESRKNWKNIDNIKELKEGFLSIVVREIADMMIEYNAILVIENLDAGFKNSRAHIEKQVYQKFENMLINKLNLFAYKKIDKEKVGSIRKAYQLTAKFDAFKRIGIQSGFLFYVPAAYTSTIDPTTGFVNLFTSQQLNYQNIQQGQNFIKYFNEICYDKEFNCFKFDFNYSNFELYKEDYTDHWQVYSYGSDRVIKVKTDVGLKSESIDVTKDLKVLFNEYGIEYMNGNIIEELSNVQSKDFFVRFLNLFRTLVQLRYEDSHRNFILSPVQKDGRFFDSRIAKENEPVDVDANGAYHIALQGLRLIKTRIKDGKVAYDEKGKQAYNWFEFIQKKEYMQ